MTHLVSFFVLQRFDCCSLEILTEQVRVYQNTYLIYYSIRGANRFDVVERGH